MCNTDRDRKLSDKAGNRTVSKSGVAPLALIIGAICVQDVRNKPTSLNLTSLAICWVTKGILFLQSGDKGRFRIRDSCRSGVTADSADGADIAPMH